MADYNDNDFVYVDPDKRCVVGTVRWDKNGNPVPCERKDAIEEDSTEEGDNIPAGKIKKKRGKKTYYPWGSYRSMKKLYCLEGKIKESEGHKKLDDVLKNSLQEAYWD